MLLKRLFAAAAVKTLSAYWELYGGWGALLRSPYLYLAGILTVVCWPLWLQSQGWAPIATGTLPSLLGFSMGGMAVMLAFASGDKFTVVTQRGHERSLYLRVVANFYHFILAQTLALVLALMVVAHPGVTVLGFIGMWVFVYAVLATFATAGQLLQTARVFNKASILPSPPSLPGDDNTG